MLSNAEIKSMARAQIKGNLGILFVCHLVQPLISGLLFLYDERFGAFLSQTLSPPFTLSIVMIYLALSYGELPEISDAFAGFHMFIKALWLYVLVGLFTALWSLLFIIPGVIKALSYSLAPYILAENPLMDAIDAIEESKRLMKGHKMELFLLELSFIGWSLLCLITAGIALVYVLPYLQASLVNFYHAVNEADRSERLGDAPYDASQTDRPEATD